MGRPQIILTSTNKTASFMVFVVCGWREEAVAGVCLRTYLVHSTYVFLVMYQGYDILFYREAHCTTQGGIFDLIMYITFDCAEIAAF
jgi:hypothetical protein